MRQVWRAAAEWMAYDTLNTLLDYAAAVEGLPAECTTPSQKFDEVHNNLVIYFNQILKDSQ